MSEYFENVKEILGKEVNCLSDFLWRYHLLEVSREDYKSKKRNRRLSEVKMSPAADKDATEKMLEEANLIGHPAIDSSGVKKLENYIRKFFKALGVDMSIFKEDNHYKMTNEFQTLLIDVLDKREISDRVIKKKLDILSIEQMSFLFYCIKRAIKKAPCSEEQGDAEIERLYRVLVSENIEKRDSPFSPDVEFSNLLREIMYTVWEVIMQQGWKPDPEHYRSGIYDEHWNTVCEHVAYELYERRYLVLEKKEYQGHCLGTKMRLIPEEKVGNVQYLNIKEGKNVDRIDPKKEK